MRHASRVIGLLVCIEFCLLSTPCAAAEKAPYWPSEREERLERIESMIVGTMRKLTAARYDGRNSEAEQLVKDLEVLKSEEALLRQPPLSAEALQR
jgi:hypothetical protein